MHYCKLITASINMKLVLHFFIITNLAVLTKCQRTQDQYPFPPQFQTPSSGIMVSDSSIYLPPEPHTPLPYFAVNDMNKLPYQFLPPSVTKAPSAYPSSHQVIFSSTMRPNFDDEDEDDEEHPQILISSPKPVLKQNQGSPSRNMTEQMHERRDIRTLPKMFSFEQHPQNRIDGKQPASFQHVTTQQPHNQNSASRRMILTSELQRNDVNDHSKSYLNSQFSQIPNIFFSSTTEPSIPILRLSNEMDLDGSFSYEALGADQTHYVQNSRMENMGSGKEEQVVEGSYSYVGDNGQTYTVHYVADSNGYRASGDHLPSPPPIPEIIQRAIQYNLAEEARRPPNMRSSWEDNDSNNEDNVADKSSHYTPARGLFTGRTPEAFSFGFAQNSNLQNNQMVTAASSHIPKTNFDIAVELSKTKPSAISPQVTFSASQGTRNPSSPSLSQSPSRSISVEKQTLPQIMNYEANSRELDQENKPFWRWQYGMNVNNAEQNPNKNTISRSFGEGDDVIINFNDMTPQQYTDVIQRQFLGPNEGTLYDNSLKTFPSSTASSIVTQATNFITSTMKNYKENEHHQMDYLTPENNIYSYASNEQDFKNMHNMQTQQDINNVYSTLRTEHVYPTSTESINRQSSLANFNKYNEEIKIQTKNLTPDPYKSLIRQQNFIPPSQLVTRSYDYEEPAYEPEKVTKPIDLHFMHNERHNTNQQNLSIPPSSYWQTFNDVSKTTTTAPFQYSTLNNIRSTDITKTEEKSNFRPITFTIDQSTTTTEKNMEELLRENIFLKNIVRSKKENVEKYEVEPKEQKNSFKNEVKIEKPKHIQSLIKPQKELKTLQKKLDMTDVLNYITMKNNFELAKTKPKSPNSNNYQNKPSPNFIPLREDKRESGESVEQENYNHRTVNQQQEELQGMIKNYKILQRQRNSGQNLNHYTETQQRHVKTFQSDSLPPLGRAGPSMKSYLPPAYL